MAKKKNFFFSTRGRKKILPLSLRKGLSLELQGLSRPLDGGLKLLGLPNNFLLLNLNLLATLNNSDLHLFLLDFLVGLGLLQLSSQVSFRFLKIRRMFNVKFTTTIRKEKKKQTSALTSRS